MAPLLHHMSLLLLLLAALAPAATAADKKVGMRIRQANKEEAQWLDRFAATHQPLGTGPLSMVRATPEEERWLNRLSGDATTTDNDGEGGGPISIDFDDDNPYVDALRAWVSRLTKQSMEKAGQAAENNPFEDL